jgi:SAM-dependent methyltransferase
MDPWRLFGEKITPMTDGAWHCPAAERNREPIYEVLARILPGKGRVLEVASGTGQHVAYFAPRFPGLDWQPSEPDPAMRASIEARLARLTLDNVGAPIDLDVLEPWPDIMVDAVLAANLCHISPPEVTLAFFEGAARVLPVPGLVVLYGPFKRGGEHTSQGNLNFDVSLRARDPRWGIRDVEWVVESATAVGLSLREIISMPANNLTCVFDL